MADHSELKKLAEAAPEGPWFGPEYAPGTSHVFDVDLGTLLAYESIDSEKDACLRYVAAANPAAVLALIAENESLKGPHDWLAEDLIKELVDNAQALQENSDLGESDPFAIVLLAAASRIRRQEGSIDKLKAENEQLAKTASCWDRLNIQNKALSDSSRAERDQLMVENEVACMRIKELDLLFGRYILAMRSALIEEEHGKGPAAAMEWIYNSLAGPGELPPEGETDSQAYFDKQIVAVDDGMQEVMAFHESRRAAMGKGGQS